MNKHDKVSFIKSGIRILAYLVLMLFGSWLTVVGLLLLFAELLGIFEELV